MLGDFVHFATQTLQSRRGKALRLSCAGQGFPESPHARDRAIASQTQDTNAPIDGYACPWRKLLNFHRPYNSHLSYNFPKKVSKMATIITISLENDVNAALEELKRKEGIQTEEVINEAVRQYLFFRRLSLLRQSLAL